MFLTDPDIIWSVLNGFKRVILNTSHLQAILALKDDLHPSPSRFGSTLGPKWPVKILGSSFNLITWCELIDPKLNKQWISSVFDWFGWIKRTCWSFLLKKDLHYIKVWSFESERLVSNIWDSLVQWTVSIFWILVHAAHHYLLHWFE